MFGLSKQTRYKTAGFVAVLAAGVVVGQAPYAAAAPRAYSGPGKWCVKVEKNDAYVWKCGYRDTSTTGKSFGGGSVAVRNNTKVLVGVSVPRPQPPVMPPLPPEPPVPPPLPPEPPVQPPLPATHSVAYLGVDGNVVRTQTVESGQEITLPVIDDLAPWGVDDPGSYRHTGWTDASGEFYPAGSAVTVTKDMSFTIVAEVTVIKVVWITGVVIDYSATHFEIYPPSVGGDRWQSHIEYYATYSDGTVAKKVFYTEIYTSPGNLLPETVVTDPATGVSFTMSRVPVYGNQWRVESLPDTVIVTYSDGTTAVAPYPGPEIGTPRRRLSRGATARRPGVPILRRWRQW